MNAIRKIFDEKNKVYFDYIYLIALCLTFAVFKFTIFTHFRMRTPDNLFMILTLFMLPRLAFVKLSKSDIILFFIAAPIFIHTFIFVNTLTLFNFFNHALLFSFIAAICGKNINIKLTVKVLLYTEIISCALLFIAFFAGLTQEIMTIHRGSAVRYALGFPHPLFLGHRIFLIITLWLYHRYEKLNIKDFIALTAVSFITYFICYSRTALIMSLFIILMFFIKIKFKKATDFKFKRYNFFNIALILLPVLLIGATLFQAVVIPEIEPLSNGIDRLFSGRMSYNQEAVKVYPIQLFSRDIKVFSNAKVKVIVDNGYLNGLIRYGVITIAVFFLLYCRMLKNAIKNNNYALLIICVTFLIYSLSDNILYDIRYDFTLCILFHDFENNKMHEEEKVWKSS